MAPPPVDDGTWEECLRRSTVLLIVLVVRAALTEETARTRVGRDTDCGSCDGGRAPPSNGVDGTGDSVPCAPPCPIPVVRGRPSSDKRGARTRPDAGAVVHVCATGDPLRTWS